MIVRKNAKENKYLEGLKHKFSPLIEMKETAKNQNNETFTRKATIKKTNNLGQHVHYYNRLNDEIEGLDGHLVKSEEESRKNIMKVAGLLKNKLKK